jgi:L-asparaginase
MSQPVLVVHGGTGIRSDDKRLGPIRKNLRAISEKVYSHLKSHTALETVSYAVQLLEDDSLFNAGTGSSLQEDGRARMSAAIMDGASRRFASVLNIERVRNPILVADALLDEPDRILTGAGATRYARAKGFGIWNPISAVRLRQWQQRKAGREGKHGTVGALALDAEGRLAAATSTGGRGFERVGRVSDSGLPAGNYATAEAAVSCTGIGEDIVDEAVAVRVIQRVADGAALAQAVERTFGELRARKRQLGAVALNRQGQWAWDTT